MKNALKEILTRENITLALSIFGSLGTFITLFFSFFTTRKNLKISITSATYKPDDECLALIFCFENRSRLPICVTSISAKPNPYEIKLKPHPNYVGNIKYKENGEIVHRHFEFDLNFPIDIAQLSARSGFVLFDIPQDVLQNFSTPLSFQVRSTRGRAQKIELKPDQIEWLQNLHTQLPAQDI